MLLVTACGGDPCAVSGDPSAFPYDADTCVSVYEVSGLGAGDAVDFYFGDVPIGTVAAGNDGVLSAAVGNVYEVQDILTLTFPVDPDVCGALEGENYFVGSKGPGGKQVSFGISFGFDDEIGCLSAAFLDWDD